MFTYSNENIVGELNFCAYQEYMNPINRGIRDDIGITQYTAHVLWQGCRHEGWGAG